MTPNQKVLFEDAVIYWNGFIASTAMRMRTAKADMRAGKIGKRRDVSDYIRALAKSIGAKAKIVKKGEGNIRRALSQAERKLRKIEAQ